MNKYIGNFYFNNIGLEYQVLDIVSQKYNSQNVYRIKFIKSKYETTVRSTEINRGNIKDRLSPSVYNVGIIGFATIKENEKEYSIWRNMLSRCYDESDINFHNYGELGVSVCDRWKRFDYFISDIKNVDGYDEHMFNNCLIQLDKDKRQSNIPKSEIVYSPETCEFVTISENCKYRNNSKIGDNLRKRKINFTAINPNGEIIVANGVRDFAEKYKLNPSSISKCLNGSKDNYKGWTFERVVE